MYPYYREYQMFHEFYPSCSKSYVENVLVDALGVVDTQTPAVLSAESDNAEHKFPPRNSSRIFKLLQMAKEILRRFFKRRDDDIGCYLRLEFQKSKFQNCGKLNQL